MQKEIIESQCDVRWGMKDPSNFPLKVDKTVDMDIRTTINADR